MKMKKLQIRKAIFIFAASLTVALSANAQTSTGLKNDVSQYYGTDGFITYDATDTFGKTTRVNGIDNLAVGSLDGKHWQGQLASGQDVEEVYLVNVGTGEYIELGAAWGATPTLGGTGTTFTFRGGKYCKADEKGKTDGVLEDYQVGGDDPQLGSKADREGKGYEIRYSWNEEMCLGRKQTAKGLMGTFEELPYAVNRKTYRKEYVVNPDDGAPEGQQNEDGKFIFYFHPVAGADGQQYYVIYTHRQTTMPVDDDFLYYSGLNMQKYEAWRRLPEYGNRDSYLCLQARPDATTGENIAVYKKFAGQMYSENGDVSFVEHYTPASSENDWRDPSSTEVVQVSDDYLFPLGKDENEFYNDGIKSLSLSAGLEEVKKDKNCLWKVVTKEERDNYRLTASVDNPYDLSHLIKNPNFLCQFRPYEIVGSNPDHTLNFGWTWTDKATATTINHTHPYNTGTGTEFHKIGTHFYDRWGWGDSGNTNLTGKQGEQTMTQGEESDFAGSIFNGSAALRQTITGLRPGRYIVYCRAFYAPLEMKKFDNAYGFNQFDDENTYEYSYDGEPTWDSDDISSVQSTIDAQDMSESAYLFAISKPEYPGTEDDVIRKRKLPSIFSGMIELNAANIDGLSKDWYANLYNGESTFAYTPLGEFLYTNADWDDETGWETHWDRYNNMNPHKASEQYELLLDKTVFAKVKYNDKTYFAPRNISGATRFFSATTANAGHANAQNYRIGLPVEVGEDGVLTIGVDHQKVTNNTWVCFDNFELVYYGNPQEWEFVVDEGEPDNCTRYHDLFDWEATTPSENRTVKAVIKRSLDQSKFTPIVLPFSLTRKQVRDAFGHDVKISEPNTISYRTIHFKAVSTDISGGTSDENTVAMQAYKPYIVQPGMPAPISSSQTWTRSRIAGDDPFGWGSKWDDLSDDYKKEIYVPTIDRNNNLNSTNVNNSYKKRWKNIPGPIYFADGVVINKETHYTQNKETSNVSGFPYANKYYRASGQWPAVGNMYWGDKRVKIKGSTDGKTYQLRSTCYYNPSDLPDQVDGRTIQIPPYSYYFDASGNMKFNGARGSLQSKGFSFYLQIVELDTKTANIITFRTTDATPPNGAYSTDNPWSQEFTTNDASGYAGVKVKANWANAFGKSNGYSTRCFAIKPSAKGATNDVITIEAPDGYLIDGYEIGGWASESGGSISETYTLKTGDESASLAINSKPATTGANQQPPTYLRTSGLGVKSTTLKLVNSNSNNSYYALIPHFVVNLVQDPTYTPPSDPSGAKVFAGSVGDFEWVEVTPTSEGDDASETNGITETFREYENPANDRYYDLQGRPVKTPRKNGIYIFHGKKIVY